MWSRVWCRVWCRVSDPAFFFEIVWCRVSDPAFFGRQSCFDTPSQRNVPPNTRQLKSSREAETSSTGLCGAGSPTRPRDSALRVEHKYSYRRRLPHLQKDARPIFVTFTTHHRWVLPPLARDAVLECCLAVHEKLCNLHAAVVMPDHVHLLLTAGRSADGWPVSLPEIMHAVKGTAAHRVNHLLSRSGSVWQEEFFDHVLRSNESLHEKMNYLCQNPVRAGLVTNENDYLWLWKGPLPVL